MATWVVDPAVLTPFVPAGTTLDAHNGVTYVTVVAFRFLDTKVLGVAIPFHRDFEEINLRFYVRREDATGVKRGVVFIREVVEKYVIARVARGVYNEPYVALPTRSTVDERAGRYSYGWRLPSGWARLAASAASAFRHPDPGSIEEFISEHYWGYNRQRDGSTLEYQVEHPQWRVSNATNHEFTCDVAALYGAAFVPYLARPPANVFVADGSAVRVMRGAPLL